MAREAGQCTVAPVFETNTCKNQSGVLQKHLSREQEHLGLISTLLWTGTFPSFLSNAVSTLQLASITSTHSLSFLSQLNPRCSYGLFLLRRCWFVQSYTNLPKTIQIGGRWMDLQEPTPEISVIKLPYGWFNHLYLLLRLIPGWITPDIYSIWLLFVLNVVYSAHDLLSYANSAENWWSGNYQYQKLHSKGWFRNVTFQNIFFEVNRTIPSEADNCVCDLN